MGWGGVGWGGVGWGGVGWGGVGWGGVGSWREPLASYSGILEILGGTTGQDELIPHSWLCPCYFWLKLATRRHLF